MTLSNIRTARDEAELFCAAVRDLEMAAALETAEQQREWMLCGLCGSRESGLVRARSMILTRALAKMRKP